MAQSGLLMASAEMKVGTVHIVSWRSTRLVCVDDASHAETGALS